MTLNEYIAANGNKTIEIQDDGTIRVLEEKGPWKPETGERYYTVYGCGSVEAFNWVGASTDVARAELGNIFQVESEAKRMIHRLQARKKFLDAGGHEGVEGFFEFASCPYSVFYRSEDNVLVPLEGCTVSPFEIWFESKEDCQKAIDSLTDDEKAALCWTGDEE